MMCSPATDDSLVPSHRFLSLVFVPPVFPHRLRTQVISLLALIGLWLPGVAQPAAAQPAAADTVQLTLPSTMQRALEVSPEVDQVRAQQQRATGRYREARASRFLTDISLNTAHSLAPGLDGTAVTAQPASAYYLDPNIENDWSPGALRPFNDFSIVARQPLLTWGELSGNIRAADYAVDVEAAQVSGKTLEVAFRTGELYYNVLLTEALERLANRTGETVARAKREVQRLLDEGAEDVDDADLFQVRLTEQEYRRRLVEINQRQATARSALRRQLFLDDATTVDVADDELAPIDFTLHPDSLAHYIALGVRNRPELDQAEAGIEARQALVDVAESDYYPKLGFQATYGYSFTLPARPRQENAFIGDAYRGNRTRTGFGLQMNLNFAQTKARVEQAQAQLNEVRYQEDGAQQLIRFEIEDAYRKVIITQTNVASRDEDVTITGEWLRTEQLNFDLGFGSTENLVDAVRANLEAEARYYEAVQRFNVAVLRLWRVTGVLADRVQSGTLIE